MIYARAHLGHPRRVESVKHFRSQFDEHLVVLTADTLPYKTTFFLPRVPFFVVGTREIVFGFASFFAFFLH